MGDFFADLRSGIQMPQVVMNQGPLPGSGGLPQPLHDTADARINYNSSLLGNLTPYAYGEPGYLSSQTAYLNIPHKIQKIVPVVFLPEARVGTSEFIDLPHPVDDGDLAFVLRLDRNSLFCTGLKNGDLRRAGLGTAVDPLINLATLNYILSGVQLGLPTGAGASSGDLWSELLFNLDRARFGKRGGGTGGRNYAEHPIRLSDIVHIVRHCIRPFGIVRGSEKQGGQNEATPSPATWPVSFVVSVTIDGKESNVMNLWHHMDLSAGDDLVLCLRLMPLRSYTLNHYYKGVRRQNWAFHGEDAHAEKYVWQLVPGLAHLDAPTKEEAKLNTQRLAKINRTFTELVPHHLGRGRGMACEKVDGEKPWQDLGYWHIGRAQIMTSRYGVEEFWHNDLANSLRTNHLDITLQPMFIRPPPRPQNGNRPVLRGEVTGKDESDRGADLGSVLWRPSLGLERLFSFGGPTVPAREYEEESSGLADWDADLGLPSMGSKNQRESESYEKAAEATITSPRVDLGASAGFSTDVFIGELDFTEDAGPVGAPSVKSASGSGPPSATVISPIPMSKSMVIAPPPAKRGRGGSKSVVGGSLLKADGTSEPSAVGML